MNTESIIRALGLYRVLFMSTVQFNSILFRVIVGVTGGLPYKAVALVSLLEFLLNVALEVPMGEVADRFGRVPVAVCGITLTAISLVLVFLSVVTVGTTLSGVLLVAEGILIGIGKPMFSGAVEAFYQDAMTRHATGDVAKHDIEQSFTMSARYGRYLSTVVIVLAFAGLHFLSGTGWEHYLFLVGATLYTGLATKLIVDYRRLGDVPKVHSEQRWRDVGNCIADWRGAAYATFLNLNWSLIGIVVLGYLIVSVGRMRQLGPDNGFLLLVASFMIGYVSLGWLLRSLILPRAIKQLDPRRYSAALFSALMLSSVVLSQLGPLANDAWLAVALLAYGAILQVSLMGIKDMSTNLMIRSAKRDRSATALSLGNVPGLLSIGLYNLYLLFFTEFGVPSVREIFLTVAALAFTGIIVSCPRPAPVVIAEGGAR